jgi:hypothetical protein
VTEAEMIRLLGQRYNVDAGNGPRYVGAPHVRSHAGFDARRTCDYVAMDMWPSKGLALHGHEVKVSRSDWLRELKDPSKSAEFMQHCDYWWLVCPRGVAQPDELPQGWGMLVVADREVQRSEEIEGPPPPHPWDSHRYDWRRPRRYWTEAQQYLRVAKPAPKLATLDTQAAWSGPNRRDRGSLSKSFTAALLRAATQHVRAEARRA